MTKWHMRSDRKPSGGYRNTVNKSEKLLAWKGGEVANSTVSKEALVKVAKGRGGTTKLKAKKVSKATVFDPKTKKIGNYEILKVIDNPANRQFARQNIVTKGAIIQVKAGETIKTAKVSSQPGQTGSVQAVFVEEAKKS